MVLQKRHQVAVLRTADFEREPMRATSLALTKPCSIQPSRNSSRAWFLYVITMIGRFGRVSSVRSGRAIVRPTNDLPVPGGLESHILAAEAPERLQRVGSHRTSSTAQEEPCRVH